MAVCLHRVFGVGGGHFAAILLSGLPLAFVIIETNTRFAGRVKRWQYFWPCERAILVTFLIALARKET